MNVTRANRNVSVAVSKVKAARLLLRYLELEGVDHIFGIPGGGVAHLLTELKNNPSKFRHIICRHETGAAYIADGFHRMSGKLGVVLVTTGPGATNALTGAVNAQAAGSAMLVLSGEVADEFHGKGYLQEGIDAGLNVPAVFAAAVGYNAVVTDGSNLQTLLAQALREALSIPRRAAHLALPNNVMNHDIIAVNIPARPENYRATPQGCSHAQVEDVLDRLLKARYPLVMLGNGCRSALSEVRLRELIEFLTLHQIPVITTADAKGIFPESHAMSLRVYGFANCMWPKYWMQPRRLAPDAPETFDALLVLGSSLNDLGTNRWNPMLIPDGPFMQVDINPSNIARAFHVDVGVVAEVGAFIDHLVRLGKEREVHGAKLRKALIESIKQRPPIYQKTAYDSNDAPIQPAALIRVLQDTLPDDAAIFLDCGNCAGWGVHYFEIDPPRQLFSSLAMGPMGFAVGAVIGAALAAKDRTCVAVVGDGAFLMHGAEVSTAATYKVGAIWIVLNDDDLHMVSQGQDNFFRDPNKPDVWFELYRLGNPSLADFARALGAEAYDINSPAELFEVMPRVRKGAEAGRPQVVVAKINFKAAPPYYIKDVPNDGAADGAMDENLLASTDTDPELDSSESSISSAPRRPRKPIQ
jgi:acetolactate synthase-1/2/3 large subunit